MPDKEFEAVKSMDAGEILEKLKSADDIKRFLKRYGKNMGSAAFHKYIIGLCVQMGIIPAHVIEKSGIERTFGHQLFNGRRKPSRDKVIQLAFGFGVDYEQTQELLQAADKSALYPKVKRDAVVIFALFNKMSIFDLQAILSELSLPLLGEDA